MSKEFHELNSVEKELLIRFLVLMIGMCKDLKLPRKAVEDSMGKIWDHVDQKKYGGMIDHIPGVPRR